MTSRLFDELEQLALNYEQNRDQIDAERLESLEERRNHACLEAMQKIMEDHETNMKTAASIGSRSALIFKWQHSDQLRYNDCYLRDLLNKGDLLDRLQQAFDELHGPGRFFVYSTVIGRADNYPDVSSRRYGIFVSWDADQFERLSNMVNNTKERFTRPRNTNHNSRNRRGNQHSSNNSSQQLD